MSYKIEALWDCIYCSHKGILGRHQHCPQCGHSRGDEVKFYLPENISFENAVDESKVAISSGPDWLCKFCDSYNSSDYLHCTNCGVARDSDNKDYFKINAK